MRSCIVITLLILVSCSPRAIERRHDRRVDRADNRIERIVARFPELMRVDTISDTIVHHIASVRFDTSFIDTGGVDTIMIENDRLVIRYVRTGDTIMLLGECKADTVTIPIRVPVDRIVVQKQSIIEALTKSGKQMLWIVIAVLLLYIVIRVVWKFIKPF